MLITFLRRSHVVEGEGDGGSPDGDGGPRRKRLSQIAANPVPSPNLPVGRVLIRVPHGLC